jgi:beta-glucosidase
MTFPTSLSAVPAATTAQWPGTNGTVQYSEGLDVGYRWYDAQNVTPLFPFGCGLSYTSFSYSNLHVGALSNGQATVTVTVTNTGSRAGTDVAQLYVGDPASVGEPLHQLKGFQRVTLTPGASAAVTFTVTGSGAITITNPRDMESRHGAAVRLQIRGSAGLTYSATGLPAGLAISGSGLISGTGRSAGTRTVTVTGKSAAGVFTTITFIWTVA